MHRQYDECLSETSDQVKIHCGYDTELRYGINLEDGELNVCVPFHNAWFTEFGMNQNELKQVEQLLREGKVFFHRTPYSLFLCLGDTELAPAISLGDSSFEYNFGASAMNSDASQRYDLILHAIPDQMAMTENVANDSQRNVVSHVLAAGVGALIAPRVWRRVVTRYSETFANQLAGTSEATRAWNRYAFEIALGGALAGSLMQGCLEFYPWYKSQRLFKNWSIDQSNPQLTLGAIILAKTAGIFLRLLFIYFVTTRFLGVRFAVKALNARVALAQP